MWCGLRRQRIMWLAFVSMPGERFILQDLSSDGVRDMMAPLFIDEEPVSSLPRPGLVPIFNGSTRGRWLRRGGDRARPQRQADKQDQSSGRTDKKGNSTTYACRLRFVLRLLSGETELLCQPFYHAHFQWLIDRTQMPPPAGIGALQGIISWHFLAGLQGYKKFGTF